MAGCCGGYGDNGSIDNGIEFCIWHSLYIWVYVHVLFKGSHQHLYFYLPLVRGVLNWMLKVLYGTKVLRVQASFFCTSDFVLYFLQQLILAILKNWFFEVGINFWEMWKNIMVSTRFYTWDLCTILPVEKIFAWTFLVDHEKNLKTWNPQKFRGTRYKAINFILALVQFSTNWD